MNTSEFTIKEYEQALAKMTKFDTVKRKRYLSWFAQQNGAVCVMVIEDQRQKYFILKSKFKGQYKLSTIFLASLISAISRHAEKDNKRYDSP